MSPHLNSEYDKTQKILEQARARSREQVFINPSGGNGYEKHSGSPHRSTVKADLYEPAANRVSYQATSSQ